MDDVAAFVSTVELPVQEVESLHDGDVAAQHLCAAAHGSRSPWTRSSEAGPVR